MAENVFADSKLKHVKSELLEKKVYPHLNIALKELINQLLDNSDVQRYQEKLKEQKVQDNWEKKRIDKILLKEELGNDYVSSESSYSLDHDEDSDLGGKGSGGEKQDNDDEDKQSEGKSINSESISDNMLGNDDSGDDSEERQNNNNNGVGNPSPKKDSKKNVKGAEDENLQKIDEEDENTKRINKKKEPFWTLGDRPFNPILSLGKRLKEIAIADLLERNKMKKFGK